MATSRSAPCSVNAVDPDVVIVVRTTEGGRRARQPTRRPCRAQQRPTTAAPRSGAARDATAAAPAASAADARAGRPATPALVARARTAPQRCRQSAAGDPSSRHRCSSVRTGGGTSDGQRVPVRLASSAPRRACRVTSSPSNGRRARQHLVQHAAERPDVAALVGRSAPSPAPAPCTPPCRASRRRRSSSPAT